MDVWAPAAGVTTTVACGVENHAAGGMVASVVTAGRGGSGGRSEDDD